MVTITLTVVVWVNQKTDQPRLSAVSEVIGFSPVYERSVVGSTQKHMRERVRCGEHGRGNRKSFGYLTMT